MASLPLVYWSGMQLRTAMAALAWLWTAALPAHVPIRVCFCLHETESSHRHGEDHDDDCDEEHAHPGFAGTTGDGAASGESCRCVSLESSQDLAPRAAPSDAGDRDAAAESRAAAAAPPSAATAPEVPRAIPRVPGPPIFLRLLALLV